MNRVGFQVSPLKASTGCFPEISLRMCAACWKRHVCLAGRRNGDSSQILSVLRIFMSKRQRNSSEPLAPLGPAEKSGDLLTFVKPALSTPDQRTQQDPGTPRPSRAASRGRQRRLEGLSRVLAWISCFQSLLELLICGWRTHDSCRNSVSFCVDMEASTLLVKLPSNLARAPCWSSHGVPPNP